MHAWKMCQYPTTNPRPQCGIVSLGCTHLIARISCWATFSAGVSVKWPGLLCCLHYSLCNRQIGGSNIRSRERSLVSRGLRTFVLTCIARFWPFVIGHFPPDHWVVVVTISVSLSVRWSRRSRGSFLLFVPAWLLAMGLHRSPIFSVTSGWSMGIGTCFLSAHI